MANGGGAGGTQGGFGDTQSSFGGNNSRFGTSQNRFGNFGQQPSFGGGFGQPPNYGGFGGGFGQQPNYGGFGGGYGGFGGGFGQQPNYGGFGGGFGQQPNFGGFGGGFGQQPSFGGGYGAFGGMFGQPGPGQYGYQTPLPRGGFGGNEGFPTQQQFQQQGDFGTMDMPQRYGQQPQLPEFQQQTNTDLLGRLGNPMPGTPEHNLRYPEIGTPEFEQLHGPGANAEAQRPRELGEFSTSVMPQQTPSSQNMAQLYQAAQQRYQNAPRMSAAELQAQGEANDRAQAERFSRMSPQQMAELQRSALYEPGMYGPNQQPSQQKMAGFGQSGGMSGLQGLANMFGGQSRYRNSMQQSAPPGMEMRQGMGGNYYVPAGTSYNPMMD